MERNKTIDNLRGLAMLSMIIIHAISYFFKDKFSFYVWDYSQWAVPVFLFCSFYVYFKNPKNFNTGSFFNYLKKRFLRLFVPYYIFLFFFYIFLYLFDKKSFFNFNQLSANIFLYGGLSFNWLVLLFTFLTFMMPLVFWLKKYKYLFYGYFFISIFSSIFFIFYRVNYRLIMWLPWSTLIYFTIFFIKNEKKYFRLLTTSVISIMIFFVLRFIEIKIGHNTTQFENKYPPTLYHLSYGIFSIILIYWGAKKNVFSFFNFDKFLYFLSVNSYSLFFIHILVMYLLNWLNLKTNNWSTFFILILGISSTIQSFINKFKQPS